MLRTPTVMAVTGLVLWLAANAAQVPQDRASIGEFDFYRAVVNRIFERPDPPGPDDIVLRILPANAPELQVRYAKPSEGFVEVELWRLAPGAPPIAAQIGKMAAASTSVLLNAAVKAIEVRRTSHKLPVNDPLSELLQRGYSLSVPLALDDVISLDAPTFELTLTTSSRTIALTVLGPDRIPPGADPLYGWLLEVHNAVTRRF